MRHSNDARYLLAPSFGQDLTIIDTLSFQVKQVVRDFWKISINLPPEISQTVVSCCSTLDASKVAGLSSLSRHFEGKGQDVDQVLHLWSHS